MITKSHTLRSYFKRWQADASIRDIHFVDKVYKLCEDNYEAGGDWICECYEPDDILETFKDLDEVKAHCGIITDKEKDCRWGEDSDKELSRPEWKRLT